MHSEKKEHQALAASLAALPGFGEVPPADLADLARAGRVVRLPAGWTIMASDTPADAVYVLLEGETVVRRGPELLASVGPGGVVGEAALRDGALRSATVSASTPITVLRVGYEEIRTVLDRHPLLKAAVFAGYERRMTPGS